jgi:hypothetical protein
MRKLSLMIAAGAAILMVGSFAWTADAATTNGIPSAAAKNYSPVHPAACQGYGPHCPPGSTWTCGGGNCWCRLCR